MPALHGRTKIYSGNANPKLAQDIVDHLGAKLAPIELAQFSDGEIRCEIPHHVRDHHTFVIQPTCAPVNDNLMELLVMVDALRRQDAKKITAVVPYYGYARQDRKPGFSRTPITSRLVADMLERNGNGIDKLIVVDIHSEQQVGFFNKQVINISAAPLIAADIYRNVPSERPMIVSPDTGGVARARMIAKQAGDADLAIVDKRRPKANVSEVMNIIGDVEGRDCVIVDDLIDTAGTLCKAASALKAKGALSVRAYAPHPVFSGHAFDNIMESELDEVVVTDTIPLDSRFEGSIVRQISISGLIAETILRIRNHQSISQIYTGT